VSWALVLGETVMPSLTDLDLADIAALAAASIRADTPGLCAVVASENQDSRVPKVGPRPNSLFRRENSPFFEKIPC
jgi:hypothetical protein